MRVILILAILTAIGCTADQTPAASLTLEPEATGLAAQPTLPPTPTPVPSPSPTAPPTLTPTSSRFPSPMPMPSPDPTSTAHPGAMPHTPEPVPRRTGPQATATPSPDSSDKEVIRVPKLPFLEEFRAYASVAGAYHRGVHTSPPHSRGSTRRPRRSLDRHFPTTGTPL